MCTEPTDGRATRIIAKVCEGVLKNDFDDFQVKAGLFALFSAILSDCSAENPDPRNRAFFDAVRSYVASHADGLRGIDGLGANWGSTSYQPALLTMLAAVLGHINACGIESMEDARVVTTIQEALGM